MLTLGIHDSLDDKCKASRKPTDGVNAALQDSKTPKQPKLFRRLEACRQPPILRSALQDKMRKANGAVETFMKSA